MNRKSRIIFLAAAVIVSSLTACGYDPDSPAESSSAGTETTSALSETAAAESEPAETADSTVVSIEPETTVQTTATAAEQTTAEYTGEGPDGGGGDAYSAEALADFAIRYYGLKTNYRPAHADVQDNEDGTAEIHLYDSFSDHDATCAWYTVNVFTGEGTDILGNAVSITEEPETLQFPEDWVYSSDSGEYAHILYLGKAATGAELNQASLQSLIDETPGVREYVNHYDYINGIPDRNMFSTDGGESVFMIVPADKTAYIQIDVVSGSSTELLTRTYSAQPVILRCNKGGKTDVSVSITDKSGTHSFAPQVRDGWATDCGGEHVADLAFPFD